MSNTHPSSSFSTSSSAAPVNHMRFSGSWYPAEAAAVRTLLHQPDDGDLADGRAVDGPDAEPADGHVADGEPFSSIPLMAMLPHAGLVYSARGQRAFWRTVEPMRDHVREVIDGVVVLAPSHYRRVPADHCVSGRFCGHETPFGVLPDLLSRGAAGDVVDNSTVEVEHAVELLLPALADTLGADVPIAPLVVGEITSVKELQAMGRRIVDRVGDRRILWLVSSDVTHYGPRFRWTPYGSDTWYGLRDRVMADDTRLVHAAMSLDARELGSVLETESTVCGRYALAAAAAIIAELRDRGRLHVDSQAVLDYYSSADVAPRGVVEREFVCYLTTVIRGRYRTTRPADATTGHQEEGSVP